MVPGTSTSFDTMPTHLVCAVSCAHLDPYRPFHINVDVAKPNAPWKIYLPQAPLEEYHPLVSQQQNFTAT